MTKKKQLKPTLYVHKPAAAAAIHRNLSLSQDSRRLVTVSNVINVPSSPLATPIPAPYIPLEPEQNDPYAYDDDYIPQDTQEEGTDTGVNIKIKERAKRYQNSVSSSLWSPFVYFKLTSAF